MKIFLIAVLAFVFVTIARAYDPPVGIPDPDWGTTHPIDTAAPSFPDPWTTNVTDWYFVESGGTNGGNGYPSDPRGTFPNPSAGQVIVVNGSIGGDTSFTPSGTDENPCWILDYDGDATITSKFSFLTGSTYLIWDGVDAAFPSSPAKFEVVNADHLCFRNSTFTGVGSIEGTSDDASENQILFSVFGASAYGDMEQIVWYNNTMTKAGNWQHTLNDPDAHFISFQTFVQDFWILENTMSYTSGNAVQCGAGSTGDTPDSSMSRRIYIGGNTVHHISQSGLWTKRCDTVIFSENTVYTMRQDHPTHSGGSGLGAQYGPRNVWFINNTVYDAAAGVGFASDSLGTENSATDTYIVGNTFYDINDTVNENPGATRTNAGQPGAAVGMSGSTGAWIIGNTIDGCDAGVLSGTNLPIHISNNIFSSRDPAGADINLTYNPSTENELDNNIFEDVWVKEAGTTWTSVPTGIGTNNQEATPDYFDEGNRDYRLDTGSVGIDEAGTADHAVYALYQSTYGLSITEDANGVERPDNTDWDIGAYEYDSGNPPVAPTVGKRAGTVKRGRAILTD